MSYYADSIKSQPTSAVHATQFEYLQIDNVLEQAMFVRQHDAMLAFNTDPEQFLSLISSAIQSTNKRLIICLDQDPIDTDPFVELLADNFEPQNWFVLTNDFSKTSTKNTAPWPYFLIAQQFEKNLQLGKPKKHRIGFLSGVSRRHRIQLWAAVKDSVRSNDVVVINSFCYDHFKYDLERLNLGKFVATNPLPWSNCQQYLDQDQTLTCAHAPTRNDHPAFNSYCNINAETCDDSGPLFFSEKTWKSYISGCLTVNYGPVEAPTWLAAHGIELWSGDLPVSNQEKISIIVDLFKSDSIIELYHENRSAIEYNQHLVDSRAFLHRVAEPSMVSFLNWLNS